MKVAVLSDLHGNSSALREVLREAEVAEVEKLLLLGDFVGYYYRPDEVLGLLEGWETESVRGNHEDFLNLDATSREQVIKRYGHGVEVARDVLSTRQIEWLTSLPQEQTVTLDGVSFRMCHGAPGDPAEYVYPDSPPEVLARCARGADVILMGHTHHAMLYSGQDSLVINPGSVGQPRDYPLASWATFDTVNRVCSLRRTPFDAEACAFEASERDPQLPYLAQVLLRSPRV